MPAEDAPRQLASLPSDTALLNRDQYVFQGRTAPNQSKDEVSLREDYGSLALLHRQHCIAVMGVSRSFMNLTLCGYLFLFRKNSITLFSHCFAALISAR